MVTDKLFVVDETAAATWAAYIEARPAQDVYRMVVDFHNVHADRAYDEMAYECGLVLTDIPEIDLSLLEVRADGKSSLHLYSRTEGLAMAHCIMNALGLEQVQ